MSKKYKGSMVQFPVGVNQDMIQANIVVGVSEDDGTWGEHLILKFNNIPYATIPIMNKKGLMEVIQALTQLYEDYPIEEPK